MATNDIEIQLVETPQDRENFIRLPFEIYRDDPNWVPPLLKERREHIDPRHNPFFEHADVALWLACRDGKVIGSISSHVDHLHNQVHNEKMGMFGFFECIEDYAVAEALLSRARGWLQEKGMTAMRGPLSFSQNDTVGLLVDGDFGPPTLLTPYNPHYYPYFLERFGLTKAKDMYAYLGDLAQFNGNVENFPTKLRRVTEKLKKREGITTHSANMKIFAEQLRQAKTIYNDAWKDNWGFVPMTDAEIDKMAADLKQILDPKLAILAEVDGEMVGILICLPDLNAVLMHINGRLFPFGWIKALWYSRKVTKTRLMILGVVEEYRARGVDAILIHEMLKAAVQNGYQALDCSWILEDNEPMNRVIVNVGGAYGIYVYRTFRVYQMDI